MLCNYFFQLDSLFCRCWRLCVVTWRPSERNMAIRVWWTFFSRLTVRLLSFLFISLVVVEDYFFSSLEGLFSSLLILHTKELWLLCPAAPLERNDIVGSIRKGRNYVVRILPLCIRVKNNLESLWFWYFLCHKYFLYWLVCSVNYSTEIT